MSERNEEIFSDLPEDEGGQINVRLKDFDGPFDTLCFLIKKSKYSLEDVKIADITEQYMEYMKQIVEVDLDKASGFITMAAWLMEIKSKAMLPKPQTEAPDEDDSERLLKERLAEYSLLKEAAQKMKESETVDAHYREPDPSAGQPRFVLKSLDLSGLMGALQKVFLRLSVRAEEIKERLIVKDRFTVEEKVDHIKTLFTTRDTYSFFGLFDEEITKSEIITTFQALLELLKNQFLTATQTEIYGDIILKRSEE